MQRSPFRFIRPSIYAVAAVAAIGIFVASAWGSSGNGATLVAARQLYGLWALGFLLASLALGPISWVVTWIPRKSELLYGRRAVGICAACFAGLHVACYLSSLLLRNWRELYQPGLVWVAGLLVGAIGMVDMAALALTSRDASVKRMGGRKWKRLHRTAYALLALTLIHSLFVGADFGWHRAPDVTGEPDAGAGITFFVLSLIWLGLFVARSRRWKWTPRREATV